MRLRPDVIYPPEGEEAGWPAEVPFETEVDRQRSLRGLELRRDAEAILWRHKMPMPDAKFWRNLERMLWILVVLAGIAEFWWIFGDIWPQMGYVR